MNLSFFQKPSRYINSEINSISKDAFVKVALAFPDIYEIGMSHLGLKILYKIINDIPYASAERVFAPWVDMEEGLKRQDIPLASLETHRPLRDFDIVGFSLQYELSYTTVLNMLALGRIPLRALQRLEDGSAGHMPLIIAGGPCTVNPKPMALFIDAFLIGDGEEAVGEILDVYSKWKKEGDRDRQSLLQALAGVEGVYVPSMLGPAAYAPVVRRFIKSLDNAPYPDKPVVPYTSIVHDRINIEVSRGCPMGCRFCQAGIIYRPYRERRPETVLSIGEKSLRNTGYEEVSFTSLSAGDYSSLLPLLQSFNRKHAGQRISLSLPSLRVRTVNSEILKEIRLVKKTGFTIAPEAGSERLRAVINKDFGWDDYENALEALFDAGWHHLKLYYMIGLPTEREEDIEAIASMVLKALKTGRQRIKRQVNINVGVSLFVPKPHTPFQWCGQEDIKELRRKKDYLRGVLQKSGLKIKGHKEELSLLEAVFARGDERLSLLIEAAWAMGCRLDAWSDMFDFESWLKAMDKTGIDAYACAGREFGRDELLPWEAIDTGITKDFLRREFEKAVSGSITPDCRRSCQICGLECEVQGRGGGQDCYRIDGGSLHETSVLPGLQASTGTFPLRVRVRFSKAKDLRYLSHLELATSILRAMRRSEIPLEYSSGFHPMPRVSFGPALGVGVAGMKEYFDMRIMVPSLTGDLVSLVHGLKERMNTELPDGLQLSCAVPISLNEPSLSSFITRYEYDVVCPDMSGAGRFIERQGICQAGEVSDKPIQGMVEKIETRGGKNVRLILADRNDKKVKLSELLLEIFSIPPVELDITRLSLYGWKDGWAEPMECEEAW